MPQVNPRLVVAGALILALAAASFTTLLFLLVRKIRGAPLFPPQEPRFAAPWKIWDILLMVVVYFVLNVAASAPLLISGLPDGLKYSLLLGGLAIANFLSMAVGIALLRLVRGATWSDLGLVSSRPLWDLAVGLMAFLALAVPIYGLQLLLTWLLQPEMQHPIFDMFKKSPHVALFALAAFAAVIVAPLTEEFFFRCVLQGWLESWSWPSRPESQPSFDPGASATAALVASVPVTIAETVPSLPMEMPPLENNNPYAPPLVVSQPPALQMTPPGSAIDPAKIKRVRIVAVLVSSAVFALMHGLHGVDAFALFPLALVLGTLYQRTGRLWPSIALHMALNGTSMAIFFLTLGTGL